MLNVAHSERSGSEVRFWPKVERGSMVMGLYFFWTGLQLIRRFCCAHLLPSSATLLLSLWKLLCSLLPLRHLWKRGGCENGGRGPLHTGEKIKFCIWNSGSFVRSFVRLLLRCRFTLCTLSFLQRAPLSPSPPTLSIQVGNFNFKLE